MGASAGNALRPFTVIQWKPPANHMTRMRILRATSASLEKEMIHAACDDTYIVRRYCSLRTRISKNLTFEFPLTHNLKIKLDHRTLDKNVTKKNLDIPFTCIPCTRPDTHLLQRHWGSTVVSERPTEARKAKGQASSIMNAAMSRRMGNSVTVINAICKRKREMVKM